jgi:hypothetical protein
MDVIGYSRLMSGDTAGGVPTSRAATISCVKQKSALCFIIRLNTLVLADKGRKREFVVTFLVQCDMGERDLDSL